MTLQEQLETKLLESREAVSNLRNVLVDVLLTYHIQRLPYGRNEFLKVPQDLNKLSILEVLFWVELINKLINSPDLTEKGKSE